MLTFGAAVVNIELFKTAAPVATFVLAVIVSTWFGGTRPGLSRRLK